MNTGTEGIGEIAFILSILIQIGQGHTLSLIHICDVKEGAWYYDYVTEAAAAGIINGKGNGIFDPEGNLTRGDFALMTVRMLGVDVSGYTDVYKRQGVARAGTAPVFPQAIGLAAMFDREQMHKVGEVISTEGRAKYNAYTSEEDRDIYKGCLLYTSRCV